MLSTRMLYVQQVLSEHRSSQVSDSVDAILSEFVQVIAIFLIGISLSWAREIALRFKARRCAKAVEELSRHYSYLRGEVKMDNAIYLMREKSNVLTRVGKEKARRLIEDVLPEVTGEQKKRK